MFKFLYTTDLHGHILKYEKVFNFAKNNNIYVLNIGADLLPNYKLEQENFVKNFLNKYYLKCKKYNIELLAQLGNDDQQWLNTVYSGKLLNNNPFEINDYMFYGYNCVPDYPFCNKDICKLDYRGWKRPSKEEYNLGYEPKLKKGIIDELDYTFEMAIKHRAAVSYYNPFYFDNKGNKIQIKDLDEYLNNKTTIEEDLKHMCCDKNSIYCFHCPPIGLGLDVVYRKDKNGNNLKVGSKSLYEWVLSEKKQLLILCGHVHESFDITGKWKENIGSTVVIQPGQAGKNFDKTIVVYIEIENNKITASRMEI